MSVRGYNIVSVAVRELVADLFESRPAPGTQIIGHPLNIQPSGTPNQQWRVDPVPAGVNLYTIRNERTATYAGITGTPAPVRFSPLSNSNSLLIKLSQDIGIAGFDISTVWQLVTLGDAPGQTGQYTFVSHRFI
jgi:hypothetical protein